MKIPRWSPDQRVDIPDMTALSFLTQGEFRRTVREILTGGPASGGSELQMRILRGFAPEQDGNTLRVKLDINGTAELLSAAIGAHAHGTAAGAASRAEFGQLIGGHGFNFDFEGNAENSIDFSARGDGTYVVRMRFLFTISDTDNRAFWNPTTNQESVQSVETRHAPIWEIRDDLSGVNPPSPVEQWIDVAEVDVASNAITAVRDLRDFAFEGRAPFESSDQTATFGPYPGTYLSEQTFSRDSDRADPEHGIGAVFPALRALARQVLDLKGQDDSGNFNWFGKVFRATSATSGSFGAGNTKTLRSVDHVTFTVGDGTTEWGDINGDGALEDLLELIADNKASMPENITIYLKSRAVGSNDDPLWVITEDIDLSTKHIEIIGATGGRQGLGHAVIDFDSNGRLFFGEDATKGVGSLSLKNLELRLAAHGSPQIRIEAAPTSSLHGRFSADNCYFLGVVGETAIQISVPSRELQISNCTFALTRLAFHAGSFSSSAVVGETMQPGSFGGKIWNTLFSSVAVYFREVSDTETVADYAAARHVFAGGVTVENSTFWNTTTSFLTDTDDFIDVMGCAGIRFRGCDFVHHGDAESCIRMGAALLADGSLRPNVDCSLESCRFYQVFGIGNSGSGRGVRVENWPTAVPDANRTGTNQWNRGLVFRDVAFETDSNPATRSGLFMHYTDQFEITRCRFIHRQGGLSGFTDSLNINNSYSGYLGHCYFRNGAKVDGLNHSQAQLSICYGLLVEHNHFDGHVGTTAASDYASTGARALVLSTLNNCVFRDNLFSTHLVDGSRSSRVCIRGTGIQHCKFEDNIFDQCYGNVIYLSSDYIRNNVFKGNKFRFHPKLVGTATITDCLPLGSPSNDGAVINVESATRGNDGIDSGADTIVTKNKYIGNSWDLHDDASVVSVATAYRALHLGGDRYAMASNNLFYEGIIVIEDYAANVLPDVDRNFGYGSGTALQNITYGNTGWTTE